MRGDYYTRGDYYRRGDFLGGLFGGIAGAVKGFATGGVTGLVSGAFTGANVGSRGAPKPPQGPIHLPSTLPVIGGAVDVGRKMLGETVAQPGTPGYHVSKKTGHLVRNRHMNPLNVKALRRADRRARSFLHITHKLVRHYTAKAPKGKAYVHASKRRSR
jgi:hypothetical protein